MSVRLRPHQEEAVAKLHNGCILYGDVGVGKTITSLGYYFTRVCGGQLNKWGSMQTPKDIYVITTAKVRDSKAFEIQAAAMGIHADPHLSTNGVKITVDSWNNLYKYVGVENAFFVFDEQRVVGYGAWARAFIKIARANEWILLSATPGDTWLDYIPVFIANGWYKHKTDFTDQHVIWTPRVKYPKVLRYQNVRTLVQHKNNVLVRMPYERHTVRHSVVVDVDYDEELFDKVVKRKWHVYENRPLRDASELFAVMRKVVNSDASRISAIRDLLERHPKLIVFYNFDYELEMLRELGQELTTSTSTEPSKDSSSLLRPNPSPSTKSSSSTHESTSACPSPSKADPSATFSAEPASAQSSSKSGLEPSSTCQSNTSSLTTSETEDPWTYLLSPDGIEANRLMSQKTSNSLASSTGNGSEHSVSTDGSTAKIRSKSSFAMGEWNGHRHEPIPSTERWMYLVQYRAGAEGWNCVETDAMAFFSQTYSYRDWWQAHGRIDRLNTPFTHLYYYNLMSKSLIDKAVRAALKVKKSFNERDLAI